MDYPRPEHIVQRQRNRRVIYGVALAVIVVVLSAALVRLRSAVPTVSRETLVIGTVTRGVMVRQVRGVGTLVPVDEARRWLVASTQGHVEQILLRPGAEVTPDAIVLTLADSQVEQQRLDAEHQWQAADAELAALTARLDAEHLAQQSVLGTVVAEYEQARLQLETSRSLAREGLQSALILREQELKATSLQTRVALERERLATTTRSREAQGRAQQARVQQWRALLALRQQQVDQLTVRAGMHGVLEQVPVEIGQQVAAGATLARVADPRRLQAQLRIVETDASELARGQRVRIDTRTGIVEGRVVRIDPAAQKGTVTVDVTLSGALPRGARPDLSVEGLVETVRLDDVLQMGRPALAEEGGSASMFRIDPVSGEATRVRVQLGRLSAETVEVRDGVRVGDQLVLSDMSAWDGVERLRVK